MIHTKIATFEIAIATFWGSHWHYYRKEEKKTNVSPNSNYQRKSLLSSELPVNPRKQFSDKKVLTREIFYFKKNLSC
jgi:hypothetical protein